TPADLAAMPFFLIKDDSTDAMPPVSTYNKFPMGGEANFDVVFNLVVGGPTLRFDMYLTFGYGASATRLSRLTPKYFNPEFNRKNAWKVVVTPPAETWGDSEPTVTHNVEVKVWDWQQGATVSTTVPYADEIDTTKVYEASTVIKVQATVFGAIGETLVATSGLGTPISPLIYQVPVANSLGRPPGIYNGIVKVSDGRTVAGAFTEGQDFLIHTADGMTLSNYLMPEFATYQIFVAEIVSGSSCGPINGAGAFITTTCPQMITVGNSITFIVGGVVSPNATITYYADFDWDGIPANFNEDASTTTGTFPAHVFASVGVFMVGFKAIDSCTPANSYFFTTTCEITVEGLVVWSEEFGTSPANWYYRDWLYDAGCSNDTPAWTTTAPFGPSGSGNIRLPDAFPSEIEGGQVSTVVTEPFSVPNGYSEVILRIYLASDFSYSLSNHCGMNFKIGISATPGLAPFSQTGAVGTTTILTTTGGYGSTFPAIGICGAFSQMSGQAGWDGSGQNDLPGSLTQWVDLIIPTSFYGQSVKVAYQWTPDDCWSLASQAGFALDDYALIAYS
ncbi:MAG: hypothetical protein ABIG42_01010, partial [bacterium]